MVFGAILKQFGSYLSAPDGHACRPIAQEGRTKGNGTALGKVGLDDLDDLLTLAGIPVAAACLLTPIVTKRRQFFSIWLPVLRMSHC